MIQKNRLIVSAILISKDQKILLGKIREGGVYPDCWHIPGGGIEPGEDKKAALVREIQEEVGLDIQNQALKLISKTDTGEAIKTDKKTLEKFLVKMKFFVYQVNLDQDSAHVAVMLGDDLRKYQWVAINKLNKYKHTPPSEKLFKKLGWI